MKYNQGSIGSGRALVVALTLLLILVSSPSALAHEGGRKKKLPPTKAAAALKEARKLMDEGKRKLAEEGRYTCCIKPTCDMCARVNGSCFCAANVEAGKGACGECFAGWKAGRGSLDSVEEESVSLLPADQQASPVEGETPSELARARELLNDSKRTLVAEQRYACCVKGGCDVCSHEGDCPCGSDLAELLAPRREGEEPPAEGTGVCGECHDGWHSGHGSFAGVHAHEVPLADMGGAMTSIAGGPYQSMAAIGSGSSILPASSPMHAWHGSVGDWMLMAHADVKIGFNLQNGPRGVGKLESQNWFMLMAERELGPGNLQLRSMLSAEPLTTPPGGFPQLFQTGEVYRGRGIVDAQHPHDLFMELAASYTVPLGERAALQVYGGPIGEPALGPVAFMHRPSAAHNPAAPLGHHWQDSTHIAEGVVTLGLQLGKFKLEGSAFHGKEPDEKRAGISVGALDSWSTRLWYAPTPDWSMQVSHGRLNEPEAFEPGDTIRTTASIHHGMQFDRGSIASALVWGRNRESHGTSNAYLAESTLRFLDRNAVYTRIELGDRPAGALLGENIFGRPGLVEEHDDHHAKRGVADPHDVEGFYRIAAFTFGYLRDVYENDWFTLGLGTDLTVYRKPEALTPVYGERPSAWKFFLHFRPKAAE